MSEHLYSSHWMKRECLLYRQVLVCADKAVIQRERKREVPK